MHSCFIVSGETLVCVQRRTSAESALLGEIGFMCLVGVWVV